MKVLKRFSATKYSTPKDISSSVNSQKMNMFQAVNSALDIALETDKR
jgi:hypothetical protein